MVHLASAVPSVSSLAKFLGSELKEPAKKTLSLDSLSKALRQANERFLAAFEEEYQRHETLSTLLGPPTLKSASTFVGEPSAQTLLVGAFRDPDTLSAQQLSALWNEVRTADGDKLIALPLGFDWTRVRNQLIREIREVVTRIPELREKLVAAYVGDIKAAVTGARGVPPRFDLDEYRRALSEEFGTIKLSAIHAEYGTGASDRRVVPSRLHLWGSALRKRSRPTISLATTAEKLGLITDHLTPEKLRAKHGSTTSTAGHRFDRSMKY